MKLKWSTAKTADEKSEYVHWFQENQPGEEQVRLSIEKAEPEDLVLARRDVASPPPQQVSRSPIIKPYVVDQDLFEAGLPVPKHSLNPDFAEDPCNPFDWMPDPADLSGKDGMSCALEPDTLIAGVIDTGIPLGHRRWRHSDGSTRLLSAWQMLAQWDEKSQSCLPFGREVYQSDINRMLSKHSGGSLDAQLDEFAFNSDTGVLDMHNPQGTRHVAAHASHGAHVLDCVAGCDPTATDPNAKRFRDKVHAIAVNVPSSAVFGASGTYLDDFLLLAVKRVADIADMVWLRNNPNYTHDPAGNRTAGYKIVINMSFGKQAGAKDLSDRFSSWLHELATYRRDNNLSQIYFVMPTGNDNLARCNAFLEPKGNNNKSLGWRVLPEDRTSNFAEAWTPLAKKTDMPMGLSVRPPAGHKISKAPTLPKKLGKKLTYWDLKNDKTVVARLYLQRVRAFEGSYRLKYTLAMPPTYRVTGPNGPGLSGLWEIQVHNNTDVQLQCALSIQTDQQITPRGSNSQRSYFDHENYQRFDQRGYPIASYSYSPDAVKNIELTCDTPVRRHGTMNASAAHMAVARIGGFRESDGKPADYSSTGRGRPPNPDRVGDDGTQVDRPDQRGNGAKYAPTAALPTDDGPMHFGILAAGGADGSVAAMRGTSFASAQAARSLLQFILDNEGHQGSASEALFKIARQAENDGYPHGNKFEDNLIESLGGGRINSPLDFRVDRMGQ